MRTGWSSLRNKLFITLFEQKKQHLWHSCCPISLVISNMKFNRKLSKQFWRILCFPIQSDRSCSWMPQRRFKDGRRVTGLVLKRLWWNLHVLSIKIIFTKKYNFDEFWSLNKSARTEKPYLGYKQTTPPRLLAFSVTTNVTTLPTTFSNLFLTCSVKRIYSIYEF